jgi:Flp pilus assembly protein TadD
MKPLEPPDSHYLSAAVGWMELGVLAEADAELNRVSAKRRRHPDVLEVRWRVLAESRQWEQAVLVARTLMERAPDRSSGWLHQAYSLRRASSNGLQQAWEALLPAYDKFPREPTIAYNLSCYACQMRHLDQARTWLQRALKIGDQERIKRMALDDPDLKPLWNEIRKL